MSKIKTDTVLAYCGSDDDASDIPVTRTRVKLNGIEYQKTDDFNKYWRSLRGAHQLRMGGPEEWAADRLSSARGDLGAALRMVDEDAEEREDDPDEQIMLCAERAALGLFEDF